MSFAEALESVTKKKILPTSLSSAELAQIDADIRERALACARVTNARFLQGVKEQVTKILETGSSVDEARKVLKDLLEELEYQPQKGKGLSADGRLRLIIETQVAMAHGYGRWKQHQTKAILNAYPAQEFFRAEEREEPRDWPQRWADAGGQFFPGKGDYPEGRMVALVNDTIWEQISAFGLPYPPFDYNSGMSTKPIERRAAVALGLCSKSDEFDPEERDFGDDMETDVATLDPEMREALLESLGHGYKVKDGVMVPKESWEPYVGNTAPWEESLHPRGHGGKFRTKLEKVKALYHDAQDKWVPVEFVGGVWKEVKNPKGGMKKVLYGATAHVQGKPMHEIKHLREFKPRDKKTQERNLKKYQSLQKGGVQAFLGKTIKVGGKKVFRSSIFNTKAEALAAYQKELTLAKMNTGPYQAYQVPPTWEHPHVNLNPNAYYYAKGMDYAENVQVHRNPRAVKLADEKKFERLHKLRPKFDKLREKLWDDSGYEADGYSQEALDAAVDANCASALLVQLDTGVRAGSSGGKQKGKIKSFGLTQLQTKHVKVANVERNKDGVVTDADVKLEFVGKGGARYFDEMVEKNGKTTMSKKAIRVTDPYAIRELVYRKETQKPNESLFGVSYAQFMDYAKYVTSKEFGSHDVRRYVAFRTAHHEAAKMLAKHGKPKNLEQAKEWQMEVAQTVANKLGNKPKQALDSYIDPKIWSLFGIK